MGETATHHPWGQVRLFGQTFLFSILATAFALVWTVMYFVVMVAVVSVAGSRPLGVWLLQVVPPAQYWGAPVAVIAVVLAFNSIDSEIQTEESDSESSQTDFQALFEMYAGLTYIGTVVFVAAIASSAASTAFSPALSGVVAAGLPFFDYMVNDTKYWFLSPSTLISIPLYSTLILFAAMSWPIMQVIKRIEHVPDFIRRAIPYIRQLWRRLGQIGHTRTRVGGYFRKSLSR